MANHACFNQLVDSYPAESDDQGARDAFAVFLDEFLGMVAEGKADVPEEEVLLGNVRDRMMSAHGAQATAHEKREECARDREPH